MNRKNIRPNKMKRYTTYTIVGFLSIIMLILVYGIYSKNVREKPPESIELSIDEEKVYVSTLGEYICPCGACDEVVIDCHCETALRVKKDTRNRLKEGESRENIVWLLENIYKAKRRI